MDTVVLGIKIVRQIGFDALSSHSYTWDYPRKGLLHTDPVVGTRTAASSTSLHYDRLASLH